ncbi:MAG: BACON domain-containing protein [Alistipes sp.]|nr:BACON domain-containing protein [Alistipes sp.]
MKKLFTLFAALFALTLVACDDSDDQIQEPVVPEAELTLTSEATMEFEAAGGNGEITYTLKNPVQGVQLEASCPDSWVTDLNAGDKITFTVAGNTDNEARSTKITAKYQQKSFEVTINQAGATQQPEEPTITVSVEKVSVAGETVNFKVTSSGATRVKWMMISVNPSLPAPSAEVIFSADPQSTPCGEVEANTTAEASAKAPASGMDYAVYVAATDGKASIVSEPLVWTPGENEGGNEEPEELSVSLEKVSVEGDKLNFKVTSTGATEVKWLLQMALAPAPTAEYIMNPQSYDTFGSVTPNEVVEASVVAPMPNFEFKLYAAATDGTNIVMAAEPITWTPDESGGDEPEPSESFSSLKGDQYIECFNAILTAECYGPDKEYGTDKYHWALSLVENEDYTGSFVTLILLSESATDIAGEYTVLADLTAAGNFFAPGWGAKDGEDVYINDSMFMNMDNGQQAPLVAGKVKIVKKTDSSEKEYYDFDLQLKDDFSPTPHWVNGWIKAYIEMAEIYPYEE